MAQNNARQALVPAGAEVLENPIGTAPGCLLEVPAGEGGGAGPALFFCLPGVPRELMKMMDEQVLPRIAARRAAAGRPAAVTRAPTRPPVQDSAVARERPRAASSAPTTCSMVSSPVP